LNFNKISNYQENEINQKELVYTIYFSDDDIIEESKSISTEFFVDNHNNEEIEFIDDFYEIYINTANINSNIIFSDHLDTKNNLIEGFVFSYNDEQDEQDEQDEHYEHYEHYEHSDLNQNI
jgi:hypothetical protein